MDAITDSRIEAIRGFNRFYTQRIGILRRDPYGSDLPLTEVRILYELAHGRSLAASDLVRELDLDAGYVSRILQAFETKGWLRRKPSDSDARRNVLALTAAGRRAMVPLEKASHDQVARLIAPLSDDDTGALVASMGLIGRMLGADAQDADVVLRTHRPGDIGWIVQRHGELYARECGWDATFEALVAEIAARFIRRFDPAHERCWIAERDGTRLGSVVLVRRSRTVAQLRLLLVEPSARGLGVGKRLVDQCIAFARSTGYRRMMLWTNAGLDAARAIYESRGFRLLKEEPHHSFGQDLVGQTFGLRL